MKRERERDYSFYPGSHKDFPRRDRDREDGESAVSTLHVRGLPPDVKERELRLLACFLPGFESALVTMKDGSPLGFIKFATQSHALAASNSLQNFVFDEDQRDSVIKVSLAKRDMNVRSRATTPAAPSFGGFPFPFGGFQTTFPAQEAFAAYANAFTAAAAAAANQRPDKRTWLTTTNTVQSFAVETHSGGEPCDTLCLRGLPSMATEAELEAFFSPLAGYRCLKFLASKLLCFIKFDSEQNAKHALDELGGSSMSLTASTAPWTPLSLELAKRSLEIRD